MKIYLDASKKGKVILRVKVESLLTWSYKYYVKSDIHPYKGNSEDNTKEKEYPLGTTDDLIDNSNNWEFALTSSSDSIKKEYKIILKWLLIVENENEMLLGEWIRTDKEKPITEELVEIRDIVRYFEKN